LVEEVCAHAKSSIASRYGLVVSSYGDIVQLGLSSNDHATIASQLEVCGGLASIDLANERATWVVHPDTITGTSVNATL